MIILDASAMTKLVVREEHSTEAIKKVNDAIGRGEVIVCPDIALSESLSALWKHVMIAKDISKKDISDYVQQLLYVWNRVTKISTHELAHAAMSVAIPNNLNIYDSLYVVASKLNNAPLLTFDAPIIKRAKALEVELA